MGEMQDLDASLKEDDCGNKYSDPDGYEFHLAALHDENEGVLKLIREAFVISLAHYWEKQSVSWTGIKKYAPEGVASMLRSKGLNPEEGVLILLHLISNVAKHSGGSSADKLFKKYPDLFSRNRGVAVRIPSAAEGLEPPYVPTYEDLRVTDALVDQLFSAVRKSGPARLPLASG